MYFIHLSNKTTQGFVQKQGYAINFELNLLTLKVINLFYKIIIYFNITNYNDVDFICGWVKAMLCA